MPPLKESSEFKIGVKLAAATVALIAFWLGYAILVTTENWDILTDVLVVMGAILLSLLLILTFAIILIWLAIAFNREKDLRKWAKRDG